MTLAGYQIDTVEAGRLRLDGGAMFGIVPRPLWERAAPPDDRNRITLAMRCLLLRGHGRTILVDTGLGHKADDKFSRIYGVDHDHSTLLGSLAALGVAPRDVTDVLLTHLHFDHVGGATRRTEAGDLALTFPDARHLVQRGHWAWAHESPRETASFLAENLDPIERSGRLVLLDGGASPFPGVELLLVDGHTRGQHLPLVSDGQRTLLYAADLIPTAAHVAPLWVMAYDIEPLVTLREKTDLLARAADERWLVVFEHDPEVACARIERAGAGYTAADAAASLPEGAGWHTV
jgi:glyoxylase-like metal-dependent hydrolase (beta-lactamase superfamily II)